MTKNKNIFEYIKNIFKSINITIFLISFFIGLLFIYFFDDKRNVTVYPTPQNSKDIEFKDKADNCYEYTFEKTNCPSNKKEINHIPVQE
tara:strand:+ start:541 stop:807 length:267 start_codon:yes stop_codon:yes gene_type:complete